jgi:formylglycine-generating enzyme required for sulfatase activity
VLRGEARQALHLAAADALARGELSAAEQLAALDPPGKGDPLAAELLRAATAHKSGMVRVAGVYVDAYEYPNRAGALPAVKVDFPDAVKLCTAAGKHLCTEDEWQKACTSGTPREFPYGERLVPARCHHHGKLKQALPAGALHACVTPEGVHDLSGNVAEWTASTVREGAPQRVIRGGSFKQSDAKLGCTARDYYLPGLGGAKHIGFRCCL